MCWNRGSVLIFNFSNLQILCHSARRFNIRMATSLLIVKINICCGYLFFSLGPRNNSEHISFWSGDIFLFFLPCYDKLGNFICLA